MTPPPCQAADCIRRTAAHTHYTYCLKHRHMAEIQCPHCEQTHRTEWTVCPECGGWINEQRLHA